jgi:hypothetical protein
MVGNETAITRKEGVVIHHAFQLRLPFGHTEDTRELALKLEMRPVLK